MATAKKAATQARSTTTTARKSTTPSTTSPARGARASEATAMLRADHKRVSELFDKFESARTALQKKRIVAEICKELTIHAMIEEEIFYPAFKAALKDKELVPEANVEHASVKDLIAQVQDAEPDGEMYDARVKVMGEFVKHHVKEEQNEMFPKAKQTKLDLVALGAQMAERKAELLASGEY